MRLAEIGFRIRQARIGRGLTQAQLARAAGIARPTLSQLESGLLKELGATKILRLTKAVGIEVILANAPPSSQPDYLDIAANAASVGFKTPLSDDELLRALLTGDAPERKKPHLRRLFEDSPPGLIHGLVEQLSRWTKPGRLERNFQALAKSLDVVMPK